MRAIQMREFGGPEVLELVELPVPAPGANELLIEISRAGVNFADTHTRENSYLAKATLPLVPGTEVAGVRTDTGERVIALCGSGGYAEYALAPAALTFPIPDGVEDGVALALLVQGLTAWHLYRTCGRVASGEAVVVHSAAGGVGSLATQLGRHMGAGQVIATASTEEKRELALSLGADVAIDGAADVAFDMAGGAVFDATAAALAPFGRIVAYGIASHEQNELRTGALMRKSRTVVGFWFMHCLGRRDMVEEPLAELFGWAASGDLRAASATYPLADAARAQVDLAARRTTGKLLLDPRA
jgi:NADPH2:quinone reductase